jgi:hypothetical protein
MKYVEFKIGETKIEFHNSIFGKERVVNNGKTISEKHSIFGAKHIFKIDEQIFELKSSCQSFTGIGINLELVKNGNLIEKKTFTPTKQSIIGVIFGILIGLSFVRIIFSLYIQ